MEDNFEFTESQKKEIYNRYLKPLKLRISQIMLYARKDAENFLKEYNKLIENISDKDLMGRITKLETQLTEYEETKGKQKIFNKKRKIIIRQIEEIEQISGNLSLEDFEKEVLELIMRYREDIENYQFDDRDAIEEKLYQLKAKLIVRQVKEQSLEKVEFSQDDEVGLMIYMNKEISRLAQNKDSKVRSYVKKMKQYIIDGRNRSIA